MKTHRRLRAERADRRSTASRCRRAVTVGAVLLLLLVPGCGSDPAGESTPAAPPRSDQADDVVSETIGALAAMGDPVDRDNDDDPDYTAAELEVLLDMPAADDPAAAAGVLDGAEPEPLESRSPEAAIEAIEAELDEPTASVGSGTPILDQVLPLDGAPVGTVYGIRDGRRINEAGEADRLDEQAALACANVEIALTALDEGRPGDAADHLRVASTTAADTSVSALKQWPSIIDRAAAEVEKADTPGGTASSTTVSTDSLSALLAFLGTCTQGGYEL